MLVEQPGHPTCKLMVVELIMELISKNIEPRSPRNNSVDWKPYCQVKCFEKFSTMNRI